MYTKKIYKYTKDYIEVIENDLKEFENFINEFSELYYKLANVDNFAKYVNNLQNNGFDFFEIEKILNNPNIFTIIAFVNYVRNGSQLIYLNDVGLRCIEWFNLSYFELFNQMEYLLSEYSFNKIKDIFNSFNFLIENLTPDDNQVFKIIENNFEEDDDIMF
ncbi:hypothetical protein B5E87_00280 [Massilimicrobiota sp. An142]|uniref:hypothetical protein n=1 Tax=Massilimicrobiota sp. An142 TaxID=1965564 RepID=UPI000B3A2C94|nr:hypothetical protein [Massilimicrobiota sp. An142]OUQ15042.1 hypothetical protein B5E87_00280 [Massilimicrobiota sp. An142]